jgi:hypothetical protein
MRTKDRVTAEERKAAWGLVIYPGPHKREISNEEFAARFPHLLRNGCISSALLQEAAKSKNADDLTCAMIIGASFQFCSDQIEILCLLLFEDWHFSHEDIVSALDDFRSPLAVDALTHAMRHVPAYLDFDQARALAVKAIWALAKIPGESAQAALESQLHSEHRVIRENVEQRLRQRRELL